MDDPERSGEYEQPVRTLVEDSARTIKELDSVVQEVIAKQKQKQAQNQMAK